MAKKAKKAKKVKMAKKARHAPSRSTDWMRPPRKSAKRKK